MVARLAISKSCAFYDSCEYCTVLKSERFAELIALSPLSPFLVSGFPLSERLIPGMRGKYQPHDKSTTYLFSIQYYVIYRKHLDELRVVCFDDGFTQCSPIIFKFC